MVKNLPAKQEIQVQSMSWKDPLEKEMALQYSCLGNPMDRGAWQAYSPQGRKEVDTTEQLNNNNKSFRVRMEEGSPVENCDKLGER